MNSIFHHLSVRRIAVLASAAIIFSFAISCAVTPPPAAPSNPARAVEPSNLPFESPSVTNTAASMSPPAEDEFRQREKITRANEDSLMDSLLRPFLYEAIKRRGERARQDPDYTRRIDPGLNDNRVNFLLFGYGETHEPPTTERAFIGSVTIISYDTHTRTADLVSFTHDIRAPEVERELRARGAKPQATKMDQAYNVGGFRLLRNVLENATGLSIDFQISFKDVAIAKFVDEVFGGVPVEVPEDFKVHPFYLDGKKYPEAQFKKGLQTLNGTQVIQYIKTVPMTKGYYGKSLEHNTRKHIVFQALLGALAKNSEDKTFWLKSAAYMTKQMVTGEILYDFDPVPLAVNNIGATTAELKKYLDRKSAGGIQMPNIRKSSYICDPTCGDGGVRWVDGDRGNPNTARDYQRGVYPEGAGIEIPFDANADGDLIGEYWGSVRATVKNILLEKIP